MNKSFFLPIFFLLFVVGVLTEAEAFQSKKCISGGCNGEESLEEEHSLLVFISFSLPDASILSFSKDIEKYGGALVIRGLPDNSFAALSERLNQLRDQGMDAPILIDPDCFDNFGVDVVPAIVLNQGEVWDKISGNVPVSYALEVFSEKGETKDFAKGLKRREFQ
ncbi:MAG: type-F conjugative transfer system pilin assembly protein TrbC [Halobacteriovoraceae bacterium]|nr:type-F conjugative transfer system pilin assembly protein TrbC [Halobacteriovoraceae bacterium]